MPCFSDESVAVQLGLSVEVQSSGPANSLLELLAAFGRTNQLDEEVLCKAESIGEAQETRRRKQSRNNLNFKRVSYTRPSQTKRCVF